MERAVRHAARDPALRQPRRRPLRPVAGHPVRHPRRDRRVDETASRWIVAHSTGRRRLRPARDHGRRLAVDAEAARRSRASTRSRATRTRPAHWPHEGVDFTGKRVGVIGTGSSAIQSIPIIAAQAAHLTVFQRTPNFSMPAGNRPLGDEEVGRSRRSTASTARRRRSRASASRSPASRGLRPRRHRGGAHGDVRGGLGRRQPRRPDRRVRRPPVRQGGQRHGRRVRPRQDPRHRRGPGRRRDALPDDHPVGTKRPCLDTGYYETFNRPNVDLVDLRRRRSPRSRRPASARPSGDVEFDAIVFATGFDAMTGSLVAVDIEGAAGSTLKDEWARRPAHLPRRRRRRLPEPLHDHRPAEPVGAVEHDGLDRAARRLDRRLPDLPARARPDARSRPRRRPRTAWVEHSNELGDATLYPLANSWYMGANVPGKPRVFLPYIGGGGPYREQCDEVAANGYEGFTLA